MSKTWGFCSSFKSVGRRGIFEEDLQWCMKEVSQNCFVFDVVNLENWGSLADLLRFWRCQVQKLRKSCRIAAFLMLSNSKIEEVSKTSFVFKLAARQIDRQYNRNNNNNNYYYYYFTTTLLLLYYYFTTTLLLLYYYFTTTLLLYYYFTTTLLLLYYYFTTPLLLRYYYVTTTLLLRYYYVTTTLLLL